MNLRRLFAMSSGVNCVNSAGSAPVFIWARCFIYIFHPKSERQRYAKSTKTAGVWYVRFHVATPDAKPLRKHTFCQRLRSPDHLIINHWSSIHESGETLYKTYYLKFPILTLFVQRLPERVAKSKNLQIRYVIVRDRHHAFIYDHLACKLIAKGNYYQSGPFAQALCTWYLLHNPEHTVC